MVGAGVPAPLFVTKITESCFGRQILCLLVPFVGRSPGRVDCVTTPVRERILQATYDCVARWGIGKTTVEDVARQADMSRATVYRHFPGGKDQLILDTVSWETGRFFSHLVERVGPAPTLRTALELALRYGHQAVEDHAVLQKVLETEPDLLLPRLTISADSLVAVIAAFLAPWLGDADLADEVSPGEAGEFLARMILSHIGAQGRWDLTDEDQVSELVGRYLLPGVSR